MQTQDPQNAVPGGIVLTPEAQAVLNDMLNRRLVRGAKVAKYVPIGMLVAFVVVFGLAISLALMSGRDESFQDQQDRAFEQKLNQDDAEWKNQEASANAEFDKRFGTK